MEAEQSADTVEEPTSHPSPTESKLEIDNRMDEDAESAPAVESSEAIENPIAGWETPPQVKIDTRYLSKSIK